MRIYVTLMKGYDCMIESNLEQVLFPVCEKEQCPCDRMPGKYK